MEKETLVLQDDNDNIVVYELEKKLLRSEREALRKKRSARTLVIFTVILTFIFGFLFGSIFSTRPIIKDIENNNGDILNEISEVMGEYWLYKDNYENLKEEIFIKALKGGVAFENDPYTEYLSKKEVEEFTNQINMNFTGIGVILEEDENKDVYVGEVFNGSPAKEVGIIAGDLIYEIDGISVLGKGTQEIRNLALGEVDTKVHVKVKRLGEILSFDLIRKTIDFSVEGQAYDNYYYLKVATFGENTVEQVKAHLKQMEELGIDRLIIDLRDNGGGYLTSVTDLLGLFLDSDAVALKEEFNDGSVEVINVSEKKLDFINKVVILQNNNSASSSEVFIIGMNEQFPDVTTVGTTTFGKGVVQSQLPLSDGSTLKITISKWLSSKNVWIDKVGIKPDIEIFANPFLEKPYQALKDGLVLKKGDSSEIVEQTTNAMIFLGYDVKQSSYFNQELEEAIKDFQAKHNLEQTGELNIDLQRLLSNTVGKLYRENKELYDVQLNEAIRLINE